MMSRNVAGRLLTLVLALTCACGAWAELQNVEVGGEVRIRGRYWNNTYNGTAGGPQRINVVRGAEFRAMDILDIQILL